MHPFVFHIILILLFDVSGAICAKLWSIHHHWLFITGASVFFGITGFLFARALSYHYQGLAITNIIWISIATVLITLSGYFFFDEDITLLQFGGMALAFLGVIIMNIE
jgi:multidrug transporter EmrE-like cation transporter